MFLALGLVFAFCAFAEEKRRKRSFHKSYARELLNIARGDLASTEVLADSRSKGRPENICYSAQQCIEKILKSVICAHGDPVPLTHTIELLLDRLAPSARPPYGDSLIELTDFATI